MNSVVEVLLHEVEENQEVVNITLNSNEFNSVNMVLRHVCDNFVEYRDDIESKGIDLPIESSVFIESLVSAVNRLNDCYFEFKES